MKKIIETIKNIKYILHLDYKNRTKMLTVHNEEKWSIFEGVTHFDNLVVVTGHWADWLDEYYKEEWITEKEFKDAIERSILLNYPKNKFYFTLWGWNWFDNLVWEILARHWYFYDMVLPCFDENGESFRRNLEAIKRFKVVKEQATRVLILKGWTTSDRNQMMVKFATNLFWFLYNYNGGWTIETIKYFIYHSEIQFNDIKFKKDTKNKKIKFLVENNCKKWITISDYLTVMNSSL